MTENLEYPCAEISAVMNLKLSVFLVRTNIRTYTKRLRSLNGLILTRVLSIFGHVTCPTNFERADYSQIAAILKPER